MFDVCQRQPTGSLPGYPYRGLMARASRTSRRSAFREPPTSRSTPWPTGDVPTSSGTVRVERDLDRPDLVTLYVNGVPSSALDLADPGFLAFEYMQQMAAVLDALRPGPLHAVHLGAGACALARYVDHARPGSRQLAVDHDTLLTELVRTWFGLPRSPWLRLRTQDARATIQSRPPASADVVIRDAFVQDTTPAHLSTTGFADDVRRALRPGGLYLANCADRHGLLGVRREVASIAAAWGPAAPWSALGVIAEPAVLKGRRYGNVVVVASAPGGEPLDLADPRIGRALRSLAVPTRILLGDEVRAFAGNARPFTDSSSERP